MAENVPLRDLELARKAYNEGDVAESRKAHDASVAFPKATESHKSTEGKYIKSIVFGGLDGIITTFAIVAGVAGADLSSKVVLVLGFANLLADGLSMGIGDYLSDSAEIEHNKAERKREKWEMENYVEGEIEEMIQIYESKGIEKEDAEKILRTMSKYPDFFVDHMMVQELGIMPPDEDDNPMMSGFVTFLSFILFGFVPLVAFLILNSSSAAFGLKFGLSCLLTALTLIALGLIKARLSGLNYINSALFVLINGAATAGVAYLIGWGLGAAFGVTGAV